MNRIKEKIGFNKDIQINKVIEAKSNFKKDKKNIVQIKGDDSNNTPSENDKSLKELEDDSGYNSSNKEKKKKDKSSITAEIDVLITDVTKDELKKLTDGEYIKYYLSNCKKELPDKFNIIIEACVNLSTQMNEKKFKLKNIIS